MAMFVGPSRAELIAALRRWPKESRLPLTLGLHEPQARVDREGDRWVIRTLRLDADAARAEGDARRARGEPWMPEMQWAFLEPADVVIESDTKEAFIAAIETMPWQWSER
jgi:hypothetical protein